MQSDTQPDTPRETGRDSRKEGGYDSGYHGGYAGGRHGSDGDEPDSPAASMAFARSPASRRLAWAGAALLLAAAIAAAVWGVRAWQTNRTIASLESSIAARPLPAVQANARAARPEASPDQAPDVAAVQAPVSADRLPPLVLPGQRVPAAVLRDLPEWVAAEVAPVETSGGSGDESASGTGASVASGVASGAIAGAPSAATASALRQARPVAERSAAAAGAQGYGAVFKRCPGPGQSGAVECRRAVCDGAAKKLAACAPYLK